MSAGLVIRGVCCALCVGALTRGLEGARRIGQCVAVQSSKRKSFIYFAPGCTILNQPKIVQFGYAFILHIYSTPITHASRIQGMASRPDKHVVFIMMMPLLQVRTSLLYVFLSSANFLAAYYDPRTWG